MMTSALFVLLGANAMLSDSLRSEARSHNPWISVPAGCFIMGSNNGPPSERPAHKVCLSAFRMQEHRVTQGEFELCAKAGVCRKDLYKTRKQDTRFEFLALFSTYPDSRSYCKWIGGRTPTEAEWEYAMRAGTTTPYFWGTDSLKTCEYASNRKCKDVADPVYKKNPWGFSDFMPGSCELVQDFWQENFKHKQSALNPEGPLQGDSTTLKGCNTVGGFAGATVTARKPNSLPQFGRYTFRCVEK